MSAPEKTKEFTQKCLKNYELEWYAEPGIPASIADSSLYHGKRMAIASLYSRLARDQD